MKSYIKHHFSVKYRQLDSFSHLNRIVLQWLGQETIQWIYNIIKEVVSNHFAIEYGTLMKLPSTKYNTSYLETPLVAWDSYIYVRMKIRYVLPNDFAGKQVFINLNLHSDLKIYYNNCMIAAHTIKDSSRE